MKLVCGRGLPFWLSRRRHRVLLITWCLLLGTGASPQKSPETSQEAAIGQADTASLRYGKLQVAGNLRMGVSNHGIIPWYFDWPADLRDLNGNYPPITGFSPAFEFPAGSSNAYLYQGGLWVGGIVAGDTLVSNAVDALSAQRDEFNGFDSIRESSNLPDSPFWDPNAKSQQQLDCRYFDTLVLFDRDELENRPHKPLGLEISQTSYSWLSPPYDDFIIARYIIRNISTAVIDSAFVGFCIDGDVYNRRPGRGGAEDDLGGYLRTSGIAYSMDNDGDPGPDTAWDNFSVRGAMGVVPLRIDPAPSCTTFSWWTLNHPGWGPAINPDLADVPTAPQGDRQRFARMASDSLAHDQMWIYADFPDDTWRHPPAALAGLAAGTDTRFLLSLGTFHLEPGDSITAAFAFVAGDSIHQSPGDFRNYFSALDPQPYYDRLYFGDLIRNAEAARRIYSNGFIPVGGAPVDINAEPLSDTTVLLQWSPAPFQPVSGYRVYRQLRGSGGTWEFLSSTTPDLRMAADLNASRLQTYEYTVSTVDTSGVEGSKSRPVVVTAGWPRVIPTLAAVGEGEHVRLSWSVPVQPPGFSPLAYVNIYRRRSIPFQDTLYAQIAISPATSSKLAPLGRTEAASARPPNSLLPPPLEDKQRGEFLDTGTVSGKWYAYSATVTNSLGLEGSRSDVDTVIPMALDRDGAVVIIAHDRPVSGALVKADSTRSFYFGWATQAGFDTLVINAGTPISLEPLSHYRTLVGVWEEAVGGYEPPVNSESIGRYITQGGHCVLIGRYVTSRLSNLLRSWSIHSVIVNTFKDASFAKSILGVGVERVEAIWPSGDVCRPSVQFRQAVSVAPGYPSLMGDSARALSDPIFGMIDNYRCFLLGGGIVPAVGVMDSITDAEVLYTYHAGFPDTSSFEGKPIGLRRNVGKGRVVLLNFPLSQMERPGAWDVLDSAMADLGQNQTQVPTLSSKATATKLIEYLYGKGKTAPEPSWDLNNDGIVDVRDLIKGIKQRH